MREYGFRTSNAMKSKREKSPDRFDWLREPERRLRRNIRRILTAPDSAIDSLRRNVRISYQRAFGTGSSELFMAWFVSVLDEASAVDAAECEVARAKVLRELERLPTLRPFWPLIQQANAKHANSALVALPNPLGWARAYFRAVGKAERLARRAPRGEDLARSALSTLACVGDSIYLTYLAKLRLLHQIASGASVTRPPSFGALCFELASHPETSPVVFRDAAHFRNAFVHGHYRYAGRGTLQLWDKAQGATGWSISVRATEVRDRAIEMIAHADALVNALNRYAWLALTDAIASALPEWRVIRDGESQTERFERFTRVQGTRMDAIFSATPKEIRSLQGVGEDPRLALQHESGDSSA
jgi:hypothetical protein